MAYARRPYVRNVYGVSRLLVNGSGASQNIPESSTALDASSVFFVTNALVAESANAIETATSFANHFGVSGVEAGAAADVVAASQISYLNETESASAVAVVATVDVVVETVVSSDTTRVNGIFSVAADETVNATDTAFVAQITYRNSSENAVSSDIISVSQIALLNRTEIAHAADAGLATGIFVGSSYDSKNIIDSIAGGIISDYIVVERGLVIADITDRSSVYDFFSYEFGTNVGDHFFILDLPSLYPYPTQNILAQNLGAITYVESGSVVVTPIVVGVGETVQITLAQKAATQDFSMRAWISTTPEGISVGHGPATAFWPVMRRPDTTYLFDRSLPPPRGVIRAIPVSPGTYYLNVFNMVMAKNAFAAIVTV